MLPRNSHKLWVVHVTEGYRDHPEELELGQFSEVSTVELI
jgi:hypothetical protein